MIVKNGSLLFMIASLTILAACSDVGPGETNSQSTDDIDILPDDSDSNANSANGNSTDNDQGNANNKSTDSDSTSSGNNSDSDTHGHGPNDTASATDTNSQMNDTNSTVETATDSGLEIDTHEAEDSDPFISDSDSYSDADDDSEGDTALDTTDSDSANCPFTCRSENWCNNNNGTVVENFECDETSMVCCDVSDDTDNGTRDSESAGTITCDKGCHSQSWCDSNDAVIYSDLSCNRNQICCAIPE